MTTWTGHESVPRPRIRHRTHHETDLVGRYVPVAETESPHCTNPTHARPGPESSHPAGRHHTGQCRAPTGSESRQEVGWAKDPSPVLVRPLQRTAYSFFFCVSNNILDVSSRFLRLSQGGGSSGSRGAKVSQAVANLHNKTEWFFIGVVAENMRFLSQLLNSLRGKSERDPPLLETCFVISILTP